MQPDINTNWTAIRLSSPSKVPTYNIIDPSEIPIIFIHTQRRNFGKVECPHGFFVLWERFGRYECALSPSESKFAFFSDVIATVPSSPLPLVYTTREIMTKDTVFLKICVRLAIRILRPEEFVYNLAVQLEEIPNALTSNFRSVIDVVLGDYARKRPAKELLSLSQSGSSESESTSDIAQLVTDGLKDIVGRNGMVVVSCDVIDVALKNEVK